jgi:hypothetical protein
VQNCVQGDWCEAATNTCATQLAQGAACVDERACSSNSCVNGKCAPANTLGLAFLCGG